MPDRSKPPPGYIVHDISTGPQCRQPWEFLAVDSKVGRVSEADAIEGAWEHYDAIEDRALERFASSVHPPHANLGHAAAYYTTPGGETYGLQVALDPMSKDAKIDMEHLGVSLLAGLADHGLASVTDRDHLIRIETPTRPTPT